MSHFQSLALASRRRLRAEAARAATPPMPRASAATASPAASWALAKASLPAKPPRPLTEAQQAIVAQCQADVAARALAAERAAIDAMWGRVRASVTPRR